MLLEWFWIMRTISLGHLLKVSVPTLSFSLHLHFPNFIFDAAINYPDKEQLSRGNVYNSRLQTIFLQGSQGSATKHLVIWRPCQEQRSECRALRWLSLLSHSSGPRLGNGTTHSQARPSHIHLSNSDNPPQTSLISKTLHWDPSGSRWCQVDNSN